MSDLKNIMDSSIQLTLNSPIQTVAQKTNGGYFCSLFLLSKIGKLATHVHWEFVTKLFVGLKDVKDCYFLILAGNRKKKSALPPLTGVGSEKRLRHWITAIAFKLLRHHTTCIYRPIFWTTEVYTKSLESLFGKVDEILSSCPLFYATQMVIWDR